MRRIEFGGVVNDSPFAILLLDGLVRDWAVLLGHDRVSGTSDDVDVGSVFPLELPVHVVSQPLVLPLLLVTVGQG